MTARAASAAPPLGILVRTGRERLHLTQGELAERVGVSRSAISELEAGRIEQPRAGVFARLARVLGLPAAALLAAAGLPTESEIVLGLETDEIAVLAASLVQLAGSEREWLRARLLELRDLLVLRGGSRAHDSGRTRRAVVRTASRARPSSR
jgi:transcriptional regulator with XRE-family HTH domain